MSVTQVFSAVNITVILQWRLYFFISVYWHIGGSSCTAIGRPILAWRLRPYMIIITAFHILSSLFSEISGCSFMWVQGEETLWGGAGQIYDTTGDSSRWNHEWEQSNLYICQQLFKLGMGGRRLTMGVVVCRTKERTDRPIGKRHLVK